MTTCAYSSYCLFLLITTLSRLGSGLNLAGMLSHVALPMSTAFMLPSGAPLVMRLKNDISLGSLQGS